MSRLLRTILAGLAVFVFATSAMAQQKKRVAVMNFDYATVRSFVASIWGTDQDVGKGVADLLITQLVKDGTYTVVERAALDKILAEQNFSNSDRADATTAAKIGKLLGVNAIIIGSVTQFGRDDQTRTYGGGAIGGLTGRFGIGGIQRRKAKAVVGLTARIVNVDTGEILAVADGKGESTRSGESLLGAGGGGGAAAGGAADMSSSNFANTLLGEAVHQAVNSLAQQLVSDASRLPTTTVSIEGLVADASSPNAIILNVGSKAGVQTGDRFEVSRKVRDIRDPATGKVIHTITNTVGQITITSVDELSSVGTFTGSTQPKVGDMVKKSNSEKLTSKGGIMAFEIGSTMGDYQIMAALGSGGMGKVYKVRNVISDRIEAMKILLPDLATEPELADRFMREIKVLASLNHPNIAALHTALRIENQLVMIMELVEGITLEERLRQGPIPLSDTLRYVDQVLAALSYAHARGIIHRDIKPANMMLTAGGVVKLMDFGIAKPAGDRRLTMTGTTMGSLYYMPPEQVKSETIDARADLYSLGVSLYELVTGRRPFQGDSNYAIMAAHLQQLPVPPIEVAPNLPRGLNDIILMALAKDPGQRFQSADAFRAALSSVGSSLGSITPDVPATPPEPSGVPSASMLVSSPEPLPSTSAAAPPQPSVSNPVVVPPPAVAKSGAGHRGLYMALGAAVVIVIVALTAMELPKTLRKRSSGNSGSAPVSVPAAPAS